MKKHASLLLFTLAFGLLAQSAAAFCGFYVAKADTKLFNEASKVVIVRDGDRTVLTMANDFQGDLKEFAAVFRSTSPRTASSTTSTRTPRRVWSSTTTVIPASRSSCASRRVPPVRRPVRRCRAGSIARRISG